LERVGRGSFAGKEYYKIFVIMSMYFKGYCHATMCAIWKDHNVLANSSCMLFVRKKVKEAKTDK